MRDETTSPHESSDGSKEGSEDSGSFSPHAATPASSPAPAPIEVDVDADDEVPNDRRGGDTIVGGLETSKNSKVWQHRFVSELAYHKFREWWPQRSLTLERQFIE